MDLLLTSFAGLEAVLLDAIRSPWILVVLFAVCLVDGFFPPFPSELVLPAAVTFVWATDPHLTVLIVVAATLGAWIGDNVAYAIGRAVGPRALGWARGERARAVVAFLRRELHRRPEGILVGGRFVPVARLLVNLAAGATRLAYRRYVVLSLAGAATWVCVTSLVSILVGSVVPLSPLGASLVTVVVALVAGVVIDRAVMFSRRASLGRTRA